MKEIKSIKIAFDNPKKTADKYIDMIENRMYSERDIEDEMLTFVTDAHYDVIEVLQGELHKYLRQVESAAVKGKSEPVARIAYDIRSILERERRISRYVAQYVIDLLTDQMDMR